MIQDKKFNESTRYESTVEERNIHLSQIKDFQ